jgi:hypothetical protein
MSNGINRFETFKYNPFRVHHKHFKKDYRESDQIKVERVYMDMQRNAVRIFPEAHDDLDDLSAMGLKILVYIFSELRKDTDEVFFDINVFLDYANRDKYGIVQQRKIKSKAGVYRGIEDLLERNLIARKAGSNKIFFINPAKYYVGPRNAYYEKTLVMPKDSRKILVDERLNQEQ